jgi:outer membrane lipase/esterase
MLAETPLQTFETQDRIIHDQFQADLGDQRADGTLRTYASYNYSHERYDQTATSPEMGNDDNVLVLGSDYYVNKNISLGLTSTFSHQNASFAGGGGYENNEPLIAAWGLWHADQFWISLLGGVGQLNYNDINRDVQLGPALRTETGSTDGSDVGVEGAIGYDFKWDDITTGPFASVTAQRVKIGSYSENGNDSTAMTFGRIQRDSTVEQVGWELSGNSSLFGNVHPYARVAYSHESKTDPTEVTAGLVTLNGTFTLPGYTPDSDYWTGELGLSASIGNNMSIFGAYDGLFGNDDERVNSINVGFKWAW